MRACRRLVEEHRKGRALLLCAQQGRRCGWGCGVRLSEWGWLDCCVLVWIAGPDSGGPDSMKAAVVTPPLQPGASPQQRWASTSTTGSVEPECVVPVLRPRRIKRKPGSTVWPPLHDPDEDVENELLILRLERARVSTWSENGSDSKCESQIEQVLWKPRTRHGETTAEVGVDKEVSQAAARRLSSLMAAQTMPSAESPPTSPASTPSGSLDNSTGDLRGLERAWPVIPR